jgi:hypothetical protein
MNVTEFDQEDFNELAAYAMMFLAVHRRFPADFNDLLRFLDHEAPPDNQYRNSSVSQGLACGQIEGFEEFQESFHRFRIAG